VFPSTLENKVSSRFSYDLRSAIDQIARFGLYSTSVAAIR
jgi:hypothetical protein